MVVYSALTSLGHSSQPNGLNFFAYKNHFNLRPDKLAKYLVYLPSLQDLALEAMDKINSWVQEGKIRIDYYGEGNHYDQWACFIDMETGRNFSISPVCSSKSEWKHLLMLTAAIILDETFEISDDFLDKDVVQVKIRITLHSDPGHVIAFCHDQ